VGSSKFNNFAAQMTTLAAIQNQQVTYGTCLYDPYLTQVLPGSKLLIETRRQRIGFFLAPASSVAKPGKREILS